MFRTILLNGQTKDQENLIHTITNTLCPDFIFSIDENNIADIVTDASHSTLIIARPKNWITFFNNPWFRYLLLNCQKMHTWIIIPFPNQSSNRMRVEIPPHISIQINEIVSL